jgi:membrane-associated protein
MHVQVTPFLPGDSLLFACGTLCAMGSLNITLVLPLLWVAAVLGDTVNYAMGKWLGAKVFTADSKIFKAAYLTKTQQFYDKYGGKTVVLARFLPIVRTFAPFVAGVSNMDYPKFVMYNVLGATIWTVLFIGVGFCFGTLPVIQNNFSLAVLGIVAVSVLPVIWEVRLPFHPCVPLHESPCVTSVISRCVGRNSGLASSRPMSCPTQRTHATGLASGRGVILGKSSSLSPGKRLHHQRSSSKFGILRGGDAAPSRLTLAPPAGGCCAG